MAPKRPRSAAASGSSREQQSTTASSDADAPVSASAPVDTDHQTCFRATPSASATSLTDCAMFHNGVLMPWVGFGTYRLGQSAHSAVSSALAAGYRLIDTAYIYAGEKTETEVGKALQVAFTAHDAQLTRADVFVITKHWRKFHGYEAALGCLHRSLQRLGLEYVDMWMMHWPGPAWSTMNRKNDELEAHGPWHYALPGHGKDEIKALRAETWRAMEDALRSGKARSAWREN